MMPNADRTLLAFAFLVASPAAFGQEPLAKSVIAGGGDGLATFSPYTIGGTIGQHDAGSLAGSPYTLVGGFWSGSDDEVPPDTTITLGPPDPTLATSATFQFTGADPGGTVAGF